MQNRWPLAIATLSLTTALVGLAGFAVRGQTAPDATSQSELERLEISHPSGAATPTSPVAPPPTLLAQAAPPTSAANHLLFVNPVLGDDTRGEGSQRSPFRTITHALEVAPAGTTIFLAAGTYSRESGEQFPIRLRPDITLQGDVGSQGQGIVIRGGGEFLSPTVARQNVTLLGADRATLTGVTVTNPNPRGYGLWIESSSPTVQHNTFSGSLHDGISVNGTSQAIIRNNRFFRNGANGITVYGTAQPVVENNRFEDTGYGINIGQRAAPQLLGNQIVGNRSGVIVQGSARPVLRHNVIEQNEQDGVVAIAQSVPDLGTAAEPGENHIQNNGQQDVNADVAQQEIPVAGNQLDQSRTSGSLDFSGQVAIAPPTDPPASRPSARSASTQFPRIVLPFATPPAQTNAPATDSAGIDAPAAPTQAEVAATPPQPSVPPAPAPTTTTFPQPTAIAQSASSATTSSSATPAATGGPRPSPTSLEMFVQPTRAAIAPQPTPQSAPTGAPPAASPAPAPPPTVETTAPVPIPVIAPQTAASPPTRSLPVASPSPQVIPVAAQPSPAAEQAPVPIPVIFPEAQTASPPPGAMPAAPVPVALTPAVAATPAPAAATPAAASRPVANANLLPVPTTSVPTGHLGGLQTIRVPGGVLNPMTDAQRSALLGLRYRVVVEAENERMQDAVRSLIPGAFRTNIDGRTVMQAGAFASLENANSVARQLVNSGLRVEVQPIE